MDKMLKNINKMSLEDVRRVMNNETVVKKEL